MATYSELREEILYTLDVPPAMTGDIRSLVDIKMKRVLDKLVSEFLPSSLIVVSAAATVTSSTTSIGLSSGSPNFGVTNLAKPYTLIIDKNTSDDVDAANAEYVSYEAWLTGNSLLMGNKRPNNSFTIKPDNSVLLRDWPSSGSWAVNLVYYKTTTAIADSGQPELPIYHHGIIATGVVLQFPHLFQGDRQMLYLQQQAKYKEEYQALMRSRDIGASSLKLNLSPGVLTGRGSNALWPSSRVEP